MFSVILPILSAGDHSKTEEEDDGKMDKTLEKEYQWDFWQGWDAGPGLSRELPRAAAAELRERFDRERGGFTGLPEEREARAVLFLLEYARRAGDVWARGMAEVTLERRGRADSALLAYANLEAYAQTGRPGYRETACDILDGALKDLRLAGGCFARPGDDTVSTAWNAQLVAAFAKAYRVLGERIYLRPAREARLFLKTRLTQSNGRLWSRWRDRTPIEEGRLADYGFYCWALTELYESDFSVSCLREAEGVADRMADIFRDRQGGFYDYTEAVGSGAAALSLSRLARLNAIDRYRNMARGQLEWLAGEGQEALEGLALLGMVEELWPRRELVCAAQTVPGWLARAGEEYRLAVLAKTHDNGRGLENAAPFVREVPVPEDGMRLYLCRDGVCETVAEDLSQLARRLAPEGASV